MSKPTIKLTDVAMGQFRFSDPIPLVMNERGQLVPAPRNPDGSFSEPPADPNRGSYVVTAIDVDAGVITMGRKP